jgi:diguanylate cyclase (GGDEF)-like protein
MGNNLGKLVREHGGLAEAVEFASENLDAIDRIRMYSDGVSDYVGNSSSLNLLTSEIKHATSELSLKDKEMTKMAYYDELTGVGNRRLLKKKLSEVGSRFSRNGERYAVVEFDIDKFGEFNNNYGHAIGDEALKTFANTIQNNIRPADGIYREGGEEFYLVLSGVGGKRNAQKIVSKLLRKIEENPVDIGDGNKVNLTTSAGVYVPKVLESDSVLKKKSDDALYLAKENGRNQANVFYENRS